MRAGTMKSPRRVLTCMALVAAVLLALFTAQTASADEHSIIRHPGDHPRYSVELEPHLLATVFDTPAGNGVGLGGRFSIPIVDNGFVSSINNNVAIGFGVDWAHYSGCWHGWRDVGYYDCPSFNTVLFPVVMQWN